MVCPKCGGAKHTVYDTIPALDEFIFRKRKCLACGHRFKTAEVEIKDDDKAFKYAFNEAYEIRRPYTYKKKGTEGKE